jgi:alanine-glyoxylate transaminase/serine-glyoxylate transaminase/serine-pyruvate transaminase
LLEYETPVGCAPERAGWVTGGPPGEQVPEGVDWLALNKFAMGKYNVELAGGLGPTLGKCWRVGIMGYNATPANVELVIASFREGLKAQGRLPA